MIHFDFDGISLIQVLLEMQLVLANQVIQFLLVRLDLE
jgi:hypothetical protein